ncbi:alpha/beta hydrolase [uncultured Sphingomonas sp.]|uniref:alpha/beta hydrolase family protein n=1 Tax=uncultured Sphingomonas sp. TaxID=158754 RepID=UPI0025E1796C|nr:alpha/beta hydrolase [uncultured Sphingomonas sp.]
MLRPIVALLLLGAATPALAQTDARAVLNLAKTRLPAPALVARYGSDPLQKGELRLPKGKGPFPVAVVIHGGCWSATIEDWQGTAPLAEALAARGIATWNIEYRRTGNPGGGWPGTFEDVAAATDYLAVLAKTQPLDLTRVAVVGHSSGAHLALWVASRPKLHDPVAGAMTVRPVTAVAIDGPGTLAPFVGVDAEICGAPAIVPFMGGTPQEKGAAYTLASPQDHLPLGVHQLVVLGALGMMVEPYTQAALASGDTVVKLAPGGANHFNIITPETPQGKQVADFIAAQAFGE